MINNNEEINEGEAMPEKNETEAYWTTVSLPVQGPGSGGVDHVVVVAEPTDTPGLVVTPELSGGRMTGCWALTHAPTGMAIPIGWDGDDIDAVKRIAAALGATPVDWTAGLDAVREQIKEHSVAVREARKVGMYPEAEASPDDDKLGEGPGPYPRTEAQATADAIARHLTRGLQHRCQDTWDLIKRDDEDGKRIYSEHLCAKVAEWGLVSVLRAFAEVDQRAADYAARQMWIGWEDGATVHEVTYDWAKEYGLPALPEKVAAES